MKYPSCSLLGCLVSKKNSPQGSELPEDICRQFSLAQIKAATNNFHPDLIVGEGEFGPVYKGTIDDGSIVAVKRCRSRSLQVVREFRNEVQLLCQLRHPLLVSLVGFCEERNDMSLVYEYMSRGTLYDHLFGKGYAPLPWKQRLQICISAARGLHYLHTGAKYAIIHSDIQSRNILLDEELSCKLRVFQFAKLQSFSISNASRVPEASSIVGTIGYLAPEYGLNRKLTEKADVFSFGVVLFEVLFGRPYFDVLIEEFHKERPIYHAIDPYLKGRIAPECFNKYLEIACSCVHDNRNERPAMSEVEVTLELAFELQEKADSGMKGINLMYEEALFSTFVVED